MSRRPASGRPTLTVDVLADVFPLNVAVFVVPAPVAVSHHLTTVLSRLFARVIRLALHPETEGGQVKVNTVLLSCRSELQSRTTNILCRWCRRSTPRRSPPLDHSGRSRKYLHRFGSSTTAGGNKTDINMINKKNSFPMLVPRCCRISPFRGCPECSSGCCSAPDRRRWPPTTSSYHWKISNIYPHIASSLPGTGTKLKTGMKYTVALTH